MIDNQEVENSIGFEILRHIVLIDKGKTSVILYQFILGSYLNKLCYIFRYLFRWLI